MKLRYKITIIVTAISTVTFTAAIFYYGNFLFQDRLREAKNKLEFSSADLVSYIKNKLLDKLDIAKTLQSADIVKKTLLQSNKEFGKLPKAVREKKILGLNARWMNTKDAKDTFIKRYTNNKLALYLKRQQALLPGVYAEIFITNKYGVLVATTNRLTTLAHAKKYWWKISYAKGKGNYFFDDRGYDDSVRGYVLGIVVPVKQNGKIIGILKANIDVQSLLLKTIIEFNTQNIGVAKVVRTKGLIVMEENTPVLSTKISPLLVEKLKARKKGMIDLKINGSMKMISYAPIKFSINNKNIIFGGKVQSIDHTLGSDDEIWNLVVSQNIKVIWDGVLDDIQGIIIISFIFIIFLALLIFFIIKEISSPIKRLSIVANRVGQGEREISIEPETDDEVGELAVSFRDMLKDLKRTTASRDELEIEIKKRILMQEEIEKKDQLLLAQSRNAAMGEMIGMIAHQWRQPISIIAMAVNNVLIDIELDGLN
ncbi:MAG: HAMP domain-containing protein, partial [Epsilonproteobacteria bacterium]|nr:HAMP domain-containing protein [Campylobacterota bacterium]